MIEIGELNIDIDLDEIELELGGPMLDSDGLETRYIRRLPVSPRKRFRGKGKYSNADKLAKEIILEPGVRYDVIVAGNFIFGDLIEALFATRGMIAKKMTISTLSLKQENVDSLRNLLEWGMVEELNLIISGYYYYSERHRMIPYIYEKLDIEDRFQLAAADVHTKVCQFETIRGTKYVIHGSANLRSSDNLEQITIEEDPELYAFYEEFHDSIIEHYKTIDKNVKNPAIRGGALWKLITGKDRDKHRKRRKRKETNPETDTDTEQSE